MGRILLVTGGAGFIGSNFIRYYLNRRPDSKVVNFDLLTYAGNLSNLDGINSHPNYCFVKGDVTNLREVQNVFDQFSPSHVVHFAAESHVDRSILDSGVFVSTNVLGTQILLDQARHNGVKRFLQISTDEVYGSLGTEGRFSESSPIKPNSPYAASKASADLLALAAYRTHGFHVNVTRCSNNYGPNQFPEKLIPLMINQAMQDKPLPVYGDGLNVRDWIHVDDHCEAIDLVLEYGRAGEVYNIGAECEQTNLDIVGRILRILGKPETLISYVKDRPGHDRRYAIDATKVRRELGWEPHIDFGEGLNRTVVWYQTHTEWIRDIVNGEYMKYYRKMYSER